MPSATAETISDVLALAEQLRPAVLRLSRRMRYDAQKLGLSPHDSLILIQVRGRPGVGVSELADLEQVSRPTISARVKRLEAEGLLTRRDDAEDRRRSGLVVTSAALRKLDALQRRRNDWLANRLAALTPEERETLAAAAAPLLRLAEIDR